MPVGIPCIPPEGPAPELGFCCIVFYRLLPTFEGTEHLGVSRDAPVHAGNGLRWRRRWHREAVGRGQHPFIAKAREPHLCPTDCEGSRRA